MATKLGNRFDFRWSTKDAYKGEQFMDWLNENRVEFEITLKDFTAKRKEFVFEVHANRMNVTEVMRYFEEVL